MSTEKANTTSAQVEPDVNEENEKERSRIIRLRENKRRSRARQKEYVQQLERRCREYEQAHVQATVEMQQAARKVAHENKLLRALLRKMGADDNFVEGWLEGQAGSDEDSRTLHLPIRKRSQSMSISAATSGSHIGDFTPGGLQYLGDQTPKAEHRYPVLNTHSSPPPTSPHNRNLPLLIQPITQPPLSPVLHTPSSTSSTIQYHDEHLQPYNYSPVLPFHSLPSPSMASTVASSPQPAVLESPNFHNQHFFSPTSPNPQFSSLISHTQHLDPETANLLDRKPLVFIRLDPTNDLYKLYPMSTIAIIPWLYHAQNDPADLQQHINNPNVVGIECSPPQPPAPALKSDHEAFTYTPSQHNVDFNFNFPYSGANTSQHIEEHRANAMNAESSGVAHTAWGAA